MQCQRGSSCSGHRNAFPWLLDWKAAKTWHPQRNFNHNVRYNSLELLKNSLTAWNYLYKNCQIYDYDHDYNYDVIQDKGNSYMPVNPLNT